MGVEVLSLHMRQKANFHVVQKPQTSYSENFKSWWTCSLPFILPLSLTCRTASLHHNQWSAGDFFKNITKTPARVRRSWTEDSGFFNIRGDILLKFSSWVQAPTIILLWFWKEVWGSAMLIKTLVSIGERVKETQEESIGKGQTPLSL